MGEYSPIAEQVSALEAGPNGWIQQANFVVFGLLTIAFAVGLHRGLRPTRVGIAGPALLFLSGIGLLLAAALPLREDAAGVTYGQGGHMIAGVTFFMTSAVGLIVLSRRIANDARWSGLATYTLVAGITALAGFVAAGVTRHAGRRTPARLGRPGPASAHPPRALPLPRGPVAPAAARRPGLLTGPRRLAGTAYGRLP